MSNALALPRLRVRRWKPPSPEFIYHLMMSLTGLMFIADSAIRLIRAEEVVWSVFGLVGWSVIYMYHRENVRRAQLGAVAPISRREWVLLAVMLAVAIVALTQDLV
jgi:hypothetical protein